MITACPHCATRYEFDGPLLYCGHCGRSLDGTFDGILQWTNREMVKTRYSGELPYDVYEYRTDMPSSFLWWNYAETILKRELIMPAPMRVDEGPIVRPYQLATIYSCCTSILPKRLYWLIPTIVFTRSLYPLTGNQTWSYHNPSDKGEVLLERGAFEWRSAGRKDRYLLATRIWYKPDSNQSVEEWLTAVKATLPRVWTYTFFSRPLNAASNAGSVYPGWFENLAAMHHRRRAGGRGSELVYKKIYAQVVDINKFPESHVDHPLLLSCSRYFTEPASLASDEPLHFSLMEFMEQITDDTIKKYRPRDGGASGYGSDYSYSSDPTEASSSTPSSTENADDTVQSALVGSNISGPVSVYSGNISTSGWIYESNGRCIGRLQEDGQIHSVSGEYLGRAVREGKMIVILDKNGRESRRISTDGAVHDVTGGFHGYVRRD